MKNFYYIKFREQVVGKAKMMPLGSFSAPSISLAIGDRVSLTTINNSIGQFDSPGINQSYKVTDVEYNFQKSIPVSGRDNEIDEQCVVYITVTRTDK